MKKVLLTSTIITGLSIASFTANASDKHTISVGYAQSDVKVLLILMTIRLLLALSLLEEQMFQFLRLSLTKKPLLPTVQDYNLIQYQMSLLMLPTNILI